MKRTFTRIAPCALVPLLFACDAASTATDTADAGASTAADASIEDAGPPYLPTELRVSVFGVDDLGEAALQGAVVAIEQGREIRMVETDGEGYATLSVEPEGGPITLSASLNGYMPSTYVGYVRGRDFARAESDGVFPFKLRAFKREQIEVLVNVQRRDAQASLLVSTSTVPALYSGQGDGLYVFAAKGRPFTVTAFEQITEIAPDALYGMKMPVLSWRTLDANASQRDLTLNGTPETPLGLSEHLLRVRRPQAGSILANDTALPFVAVQRVVTRIPVEIHPVAAVTAFAPWYQTEDFEITLTGPKKELSGDGLTLTVTIADPQGRSSAVTVEGSLPERVDLPFLEPPQLSTVGPDISGMITWQEPDDPLAWPVFSLTAGFDQVWVVAGFPGVTSFDLAALRATLASDSPPFDSLRAALSFCDTEGVGSYCTRVARGVAFELTAKDEARR